MTAAAAERGKGRQTAGKGEFELEPVWAVSSSTAGRTPGASAGIRWAGPTQRSWGQVLAEPIARVSDQVSRTPFALCDRCARGTYAACDAHIALGASLLL